MLSSQQAGKTASWSSEIRFLKGLQQNLVIGYREISERKNNKEFSGR